MVPEVYNWSITLVELFEVFVNGLKNELDVSFITSKAGFGGGVTVGTVRAGGYAGAVVVVVGVEAFDFPVDFGYLI